MAGRPDDAAARSADPPRPAVDRDPVTAAAIASARAVQPDGCPPSPKRYRHASSGSPGPGSSMTSSEGHITVPEQ
ncbi:hypothetical protein [Streptomyces malaysiensis]|uniref:hypothetical protein n=1 Tax=Streptomyces malaysiensis TaxID=92644 RepID=UPI002B31ABB2|nr:hypothetical protein R8789_40410 [Streptomyces malaysiensis]